LNETNTSPDNCERPVLLPANLGGLADFTGEALRGYALSAVHLVVTPETYRAEATDGRQAVIITGPRDAAVEEALQQRAVPGALGDKTEALVPVEEWRRAFQGAAKSSRALREHPEWARVAVSMDADETTLSTTNEQGGTLVRAVNIRGPFPKIDVVVPHGPPTAQITVNPQYLAELLRLAARVAGEQPVTIEFYADIEPAEDAQRRGTLRFTEPLVLRASGPGQDLLALLMPMT
jgi:hypothetical protein